jgi:DNA-binding XRE family transcriptional regulator
MARKPKPRILIAKLLGESLLNHRQIADTVGCSQKTVQRVEKELKKHMEPAESQLAEYAARLNERLPLAARVEKIASIAENTTDMKTALAAVQRADDLSGFVTQKDKIRLPRQEAPRQQGPMFLMVGAHIEVHAPRRKKVINMGEPTEQVNAGETE